MTGIDLDNTIISYGKLLKTLAVEKGFVEVDFPADKTAIRNQIRQLPDGEEEWQKLQAVMYGERLAEAEIFPGVIQFFRECLDRDVPVCIISHKTRHSNFFGGGADFHAAATKWLEAQGFFAADGVGLSREMVFYEPNRQKKSERIRTQGCVRFVDDLEEMFTESAFPQEVEKLLFRPHGGAASGLPGVREFADWQAIRKHVFS